MIRLRDYQSSLITQAASVLSRHRAAVVVAPTGSGKGTILTEYARQRAADNQRVWLMVHRNELVADLSGRLTAAELAHGLVVAGKRTDWEQPVLLASVPTLIKRLERETVPPPDLIIVDECHHVVETNTWGDIIGCFPSAKVLGFTATPARLDGRGLGRPHGVFDELVLGPSVAELTARGFLAPARYYCPPQVADTANLRTRAGDYVASDAAEALSTGEVFGSVVEHYRQLLDGRTAIAFCCSVQHAESVAAALSDAGITAESLDGRQSAKHRRAALARLESGETMVVTSCMVLGEGIDIPTVGGAILLRPTMSLALHLQMIGRALRPKPDGSPATILDHVGNLARHGFADDHREWTLKGQDRSRNTQPEDAAPSITTCPQCLAANRSGVSNCTACGYEFQPGDAPIREIDGKLIEAVRDGRRIGAAVRIGNDADPVVADGFRALNDDTAEPVTGVWYVAATPSDTGLVELCRNPHDAQAHGEGRGIGITTCLAMTEWLRYVADHEYSKPKPTSGARTVQDLLEIERRRGYQPGWHQRVAGARLRR